MGDRCGTAEGYHDHYLTDKNYCGPCRKAKREKDTAYRLQTRTAFVGQEYVKIPTAYFVELYRQSDGDMRMRLRKLLGNGKVTKLVLGK